MAANETSGPVLFFDGVCNLCNSSVLFIIRHDRREIFRFASLQSLPGLKALQQVNDKNGGAGSVILYYNGKYYTRSAAVLHTLRLLGGMFQVAYPAILIPRFIRDAVYNLISRNRYKWFGKKTECMVPTPELKKRFLVSGF